MNDQDSLSDQLEQHAITRQVAADILPLHMELRKLRALNVELLAALKGAEAFIRLSERNDISASELLLPIRAAIAKAEAP